MKEYNTLGDRIKGLRCSLSLSQAELAQQLHCTQAALSQYENGNREPGLQDLVQIASALHTSTDYLLGLTDVKSLDFNIKSIGDYLGLNEESISVLRNLYWKHKRKTTEEYLQNEVEFYSGAVPGDETYEQDFSYMLHCSQVELEDYVKFINEFICSSAFSFMKECLCKNLYVERTIYDLFRVVLRKYDQIQSPVFESNIAATAYVLTEESEDFIKEYSLNIFDSQSAVLEFCKNFTALERVKELDYKESFYKKLHFYVYSFTRPMFESNNYSAEELDEAMKKDEFNLRLQVNEVIKDSCAEKTLH